MRLIPFQTQTVSSETQSFVGGCKLLQSFVLKLNFLVFCYLQESGFTHAAFSQGYEANIDKTTIDGSAVPLGALITVVHKGLQYIEMEENPSHVDTEEDGDFSFLRPMDLTRRIFEHLNFVGV